MQTMNVDFDNTFTSNPIFWTKVIKLAQESGINIICISARRDCEESRKFLTQSFPDGVIIYFTNHNPKIEYAKKRNIKVDIWIEDNPKALFESDCPERQIKDESVPIMQ